MRRQRRARAELVIDLNMAYCGGDQAKKHLKYLNGPAD